MVNLIRIMGWLYLEDYAFTVSVQNPQASLVLAEKTKEGGAVMVQNEPDDGISIFCNKPHIDKENLSVDEAKTIIGNLNIE